MNIIARCPEIRSHDVFFSSRRRHTRFDCDWSSDVCSSDLAIIRLEQLYPLRCDLLEVTLGPYGEGTPVVWVQEEPANMGAWIFMKLQFGDSLFEIGRASCRERV